MRKQYLPRRILAARHRVRQMLRTHLLHEIAARKWLGRRATIVEQQLELLAADAAPMPARIADIQISKIDNVRRTNDKCRQKARKERRLFYEIRIAPDEP